MNTLKRIEGKNTCLTYCVAHILKINPKKTPFFIKNKYWLRRSLNNFLRKRGLCYHLYIFKTFDKKVFESIRGKYIVSGKSPRSKSKKRFDARALNHAVVYKSGKMIYDPADNGKGIIGYPEYIIKIKKL